jgi:hypothetical protein
MRTLSVAGVHFQLAWTRSILNFYARTLDPWTLFDDILRIYDTTIAGIYLHFNCILFILQVYLFVCTNQLNVRCDRMTD